MRHDGSGVKDVLGLEFGNKGRQRGIQILEAVVQLSADARMRVPATNVHKKDIALSLSVHPRRNQTGDLLELPRQIDFICWKRRLEL